jgi:hypothetical protein
MEFQKMQNCELTLLSREVERIFIAGIDEIDDGEWSRLL